MNISQYHDIWGFHLHLGFSLFHCFLNILFKVKRRLLHKQDVLNKHSLLALNTTGCAVFFVSTYIVFLLRWAVRQVSQVFVHAGRGGQDSIFFHKKNAPKHKHMFSHWMATD